MAMMAPLWVLLLVLFEQHLLVLVSLLSSVLESELVLVFSKCWFSSSKFSSSEQSVVVMMIYLVYLVVLSIHLAKK